MNYKKCYTQIINNRTSNILDYDENRYTENHHIIPRSLGGTDEKDNLVRLSAREHYICHWLLTKMYKEGSVEWCKMIKAFSMLAFTQNDTDHKRYMPSRRYALLREQFSKAQSISQTGNKNSQYGTCWISNMNDQVCIKIRNDELSSNLKLGWTKKRVTNWDLFDKSTNRIPKRKRVTTNDIKKPKPIWINNPNKLECKQIMSDKFSDYVNDCWVKGKNEFVVEKRRITNRVLATETYNEFCDGSYSSIRDYVRQTELYDKSHVSLTKLWKKHISSYSANVKQGQKFVV